MSTYNELVQLWLKEKSSRKVNFWEKHYDESYSTDDYDDDDCDDDADCFCD